MRIGSWLSICLASVLTLAVLSPTARADGPAASPPNVFDLPQLQIRYALLQAKIKALLDQGNYAEAEQHCRAAAELVPYDPNVHYNLACVLARQGKTADALAGLEKAVELGFVDAEHIRGDEDLASLREEERFAKAVEAARTAKPDPGQGWKYQVEPAPIVDGVATVDEKNTAWDPRLGVFRSLFKFDAVPPPSGPAEERPAEPASEPAAEPASEPAAQPSLPPPIKGFGEVGELVDAWWSEGTAAGNRGDLYDNHDSDHSNMNYGMFPQLARIEFGEGPKSRGFHHGLQIRFLYNGVTIGNSSTAITSGPIWRSQARLAVSNPRSAALLYVQYRANHLYVYPEHRDHDPGPGDGKGHGDVFPVNTPYLIVSQGSSGSDRVFLQAVAATLAAFRPEVKAELVRTGTLMPAVQMIFRRSNKMVAAEEDYLTGKAHPTVFDGNQLDAAAMVKAAHEVAKDALPPMVGLKVVEEDQPRPGRDYFAAEGQGETLFDTPCAIARVVRTVRYERRMVVSAEPSADTAGRPLTFHWAVLRGDPERIAINKLNDEGSVVELRVGYHPRRPVRPGSDLESNRVDIGAFVHNGVHYSAPAFVTFFYLDNEKREYDEEHRIRVADYADPEVSKRYVDPLIDARKNWRDEYHYDDAGELTGWTRLRGDAREEFTAEGLLVTSTDAEGRPVEARRVRYLAKPQPGHAPVIEQETTDEAVKLD